MRKVEQGTEGLYQTLTLENGTKLKYEPEEMIDAIFAAIEGRDHPLLLYIRRMDTNEGIPGLVRALEGNGDAERNGEQVAQSVRRSARLVADRSAGVAVVVANDEPRACGETLTELILPPEH